MLNMTECKSTVYLCSSLSLSMTHKFRYFVILLFIKASPLAMLLKFKSSAFRLTPCYMDGLTLINDQRATSLLDYSS